MEEKKTNSKTFYWIKLDKDFFNSSAISIIKHYENWTEIVCFYLQLMCESVNHTEGLKHDATRPYTKQELSFLTNIEERRIEEILTVLQEQNLLEIKEDGALFLPKLKENIDSITSEAIRKRKQREGQKRDNDGTMSRDINKELEIEKDNKKNYNKKKTRIVSTPEWYKDYDKSVKELKCDEKSAIDDLSKEFEKKESAKG